jgi:hypothetical protein
MVRSRVGLVRMVDWSRLLKLSKMAVRSGRSRELRFSAWGVCALTGVGWRVMLFAEA